MYDQTHSIQLDAEAIGDDKIHSWSTKINGTHSSITEYYFTHDFNIGHRDDLMVRVHSITFSDGIQIARCPNPHAYVLIRPDQEKVTDSLGGILDLLNAGE